MKAKVYASHEASLLLRSNIGGIYLFSVKDGGTILNERVYTGKSEL